MVRYRGVDSFGQDDTEFGRQVVESRGRERVLDRFADGGVDVLGEGFGKNIVDGGGDYAGERSVECVMDGAIDIDPDLIPEFRDENTVKGVGEGLADSFAYVYRQCIVD